jgi:hypothetical protein
MNIGYEIVLTDTQESHERRVVRVNTNVTNAQIASLREAATDDVSLDGLRVTVDEATSTYTFATPDESHNDLTEDEFIAVAENNAEYVTNWYYWTQSDLTEDEQAYLRWLERADSEVPERYDTLADSIERTWGEVRIVTSINEAGQRRYTLHNESDNARDNLEEYDDPLDARQIAKYDNDGQYRPLKTAPTLQTGWQFTGLTGKELLRTIDFIYPATVQNWYLERHDALDVSHWRETAERQTGIYDVIDALDPEAVEWLAQSCCVDSQCLKRRQWDEDGETPLDVPRGDGEFPCREPCSLVIAAARKWTLLEREQPREYTFTLTPSEKEQVEEIIDAVADGRADDIREADMGDGANRYRTRYLKAKRFDENGRLSGVPTDTDEYE